MQSPSGMVFMIWLQLFVVPASFPLYWRSRTTLSPQPWKTSEKLFAISGRVILVPILGYLVTLAETRIDILHKHPRLIEVTVRALVKNQEPKVVFKLLRSFEKGVLVQEIETAKIRFFQWTEVLSLQYPVD